MERRKRWGRWLVLLGVSAWAPYALLKYGMGHEVLFSPFLAAHLAGVIPGTLLSRGDRWIQRLRQRRIQR